MATGPTDIPKIMRANGWKVGAALMDHWFSLPKSEAPPYAYRNDTIVTMAWVIGFERAKQVYDQLIKDKIWSNDAAKVEVRKLLDRYGLLRGIGGCFGVFQSTQPIIHQNHVNTRAVKQAMLADLDDMTAALANFNFHVQIGGEATPVLGTGKCRVSVDTIGVYIRDQYDFIGDQDLGYWDKSDNKVSARNPFTGDKITNETFRDWRTANNKGGDFEVFSDVRVTTLTSPDVFEV